MNIDNYLVNQYDSGIQNRMKSEHMKESGNTSTARISPDLNGIKEGVVFKGEILDISGNKVTIELENQAKLLARLQEGIELGVGDRLLFSVKENQNNQILIKPLFDSLYSARTQTLEKVLDAAGLSPTERNFTAAKELMDAGMPVDKGSIVKILSQSMKYDGASMQTLVSLNKMNIPVTAESIAQYERYQNYSHQLAGDLADAAGSIADFAGSLSEKMSAKEMLSLTSEILDIFSKDFSSVSNEQPGLFSENGGEGAMISEQTADDMVHPALQGKEELPDKGMAMKNVAPMEEGIFHTDSVPVDGKTQNVRLEYSKDNAGAEQMVNGNQTKGMEHSPEELLRQIINNLDGKDAATVHKVISSNEFKKLLLDLVKANWFIDPKTMKKPKEIDELYNKILRQSKAFEDALSAKNGDTGQFNQSSQNMRQNMSFMEQINNQMIYAQMPLKLSNQNANSELFVYADKRKLAQKSDGISVMLHLDMEHLGMTDIKVTLTGSNVNARFYLNDQECVDIVAENMNQLESRLLERGFSLSNEVVKRQPQESINKVVDEIIDENAERSIKRYTFDMRT